MDPSDGFSEDHADVHRLDLGALQFLDLVGDRVADDDLGEEKKKSHHDEEKG